MHPRQLYQNEQLELVLVLGKLTVTCSLVLGGIILIRSVKDERWERRWKSRSHLPVLEGNEDRSKIEHCQKSGESCIQTTMKSRHLAVWRHILMTGDYCWSLGTHILYGNSLKVSVRSPTL